MLENLRKGSTWLPYDDLIMKTVIHVGFYLEMEESIKSYTKIGKQFLNHMQIKD